MPKKFPPYEPSPPSSLAFLSRESVQHFTESLSEGVIVLDADGIIYHINHVAQRLHQGGDIPVPNEALADTSPHDWIEARKVLATGIPQICVLLRLPQATVVVNRMPMVRGDAIVGVVTVMQDLNNFHAIIHEFSAYRKLAREFETVIDQFDDIVLTLNSHGIIRNANASYEKLISLGRQGIIGRHIDDIQRSPPALVELYREALASQTRVSRPVLLPKGVMLQGLATPSFDAAGNLFRVLLHLRQAVAQAEPATRPDRAVPTPNRPSPPSLEMQKICLASGFTVHSSAMNQVVRQALKASATHACVLIQGESGVGKTMLATLIHNNSQRSGQPCVVINCGAIPDHLLESELFGYEKGAFTGANTHGKPGLIETADKGTLFLDEIGELHYSLQSKLLEVIEKKSFIRVGGTRRTAVDIRILAATNKNLAEEVEGGNFRRDLFYRLNVIPLSIPPLRQRPEDVKAMIGQLINQWNTRNGTAKTMSPDLLRWLLRYSFPGNMRELVNIMEWLLVMSEGETLTLGDLPARLRQADPVPVSPVTEIDPSAFSAPASVPGEAIPTLAARALEDGLPLKDALTLFERNYLQTAMDRYGSLQKVSQALDVHFSTLWRKLVKYGLAPGNSARKNHHDD